MAFGKEPKYRLPSDTSQEFSNFKNRVGISFAHPSTCGRQGLVYGKRHIVTM